jgi:group I intron endonuclease
MSLKYPKGAGVYKLTCVKNGKVYIGKSVNMYFRLSCHKSCEKKSKGRHYIESAIIKHGWNSFNIEILETIDNFDKMVDNDELLKKESYYIELYDSTNNDKGYNFCKHSTDRTGIKASDETRRRISLSQIGRKHSEETKEKIRQARLGKAGTPHTAEHKERMRKINLGKKMSTESKDKLRQIKLGKKLSDETKLKMGNSKIGNSNALGFKHSEETKEKLRQAKLRNKLAKLDALIDVGLSDVATQNIEVNI